MNIENTKYTNRLSKESSPYLLQHAHNPVDWYPWGDEAFERARSENKMIFLSIGYSTCHWCHVMEKESFEDEEVAELMNRAFVSIKVDREQRPDLDAVYMESAMLLSGRGGWPLNLILTPDKKPFYAATYIPNKNLMQLIPQVEVIWSERPGEIISTTEKLMQALKDNNQKSAAGLTIETSAIITDKAKDEALSDLEKRYDAEYGGFNRQPKFPQPQNLLFLLRQYNSTGDKNVLEMVENTLFNMRSGGIFDQIGYGFHRYSTNREWKLPHFEKMLYDQAMLLLAYTETWQITGDIRYKQTADEIIEYVLRDMRAPEGGFYSAEDADSEGEEGKFYLWDYNEFMNLLDKNGFDGEKYAAYFKMENSGNFNDEASGLKTGENILYLSPNDTDSHTPSDFNEVRSLLFREREKRIHPYKDDKILTDWNGLMIFALARASWIFDNSDYYEAARNAAEFLLTEMRQTDSSLLHSYRLGKSGTIGMIDDYAFLSRGLLELYRAGFEAEYVEAAINLTEYALEYFEDAENGGFFQSNRKQTDLLIRKKEVLDNATPSGNSIMHENLMQLFKITGDTKWRTSAEALLTSLSTELSTYPSAFGMLLSSTDYSGSGGREIIIVGEETDTLGMLQAVNSRFQPGTVVLRKTTESAVRLKDIAAYTEYYTPPNNQAAAVYVCTDFTCNKPVFSVKDLNEMLGQQEFPPE